jgi:hypothetical protein
MASGADAPSCVGAFALGASREGMAFGAARVGSRSVPAEAGPRSANATSVTAPSDFCGMSHRPNGTFFATL